MDCLEGAWEGDAVMSGRSWLDAVVRRRVRERMKGKFEGSCMLISRMEGFRVLVDAGSTCSIIVGKTD